MTTPCTRFKIVEGIFSGPSSDLLDQGPGKIAATLRPLGALFSRAVQHKVHTQVWRCQGEGTVVGDYLVWDYLVLQSGTLIKQASGKLPGSTLAEYDLRALGTWPIFGQLYPYSARMDPNLYNRGNSPESSLALLDNRQTKEFRNERCRVAATRSRSPTLYPNRCPRHLKENLGLLGESSCYYYLNVGSSPMHDTIGLL